MELIILGSGTSTGVPEIGCGCVVCQSKDIRDKRLRTSALVITNSGKRILIDCGPDFREQALFWGIDDIDAILITHEHYDHVYGLDDMRTIAWKKEIPIFGQKRALDSIRNRMHYVFSEHPYPGTPKFSLNIIDNKNTPFTICDIRITPIEVNHGYINILGYRFNDDLCYITDMKNISDSEKHKLYGVSLLIVNALRYKKSHPSHQSVEDVYNLLQTIESQTPITVLTHISHHAPTYKEFEKKLPQNIKAAFDNMCISIINGIVKFENNIVKNISPFEIINLHRIDYKDAWEEQKNLFSSIIESKRKGLKTTSTLLICEHNPVFTLGLHGKKTNLLISEEFLRNNGYQFFEVERGGDITYHGPGQITGYPIFDLEYFNIGVKKYISLMQECIISLLSLYNIKGELDSNATGIWIDVDDPNKSRKICAIGVKCSRYVTMHGFALNVNNSLDPFDLINPCGFIKGRVTSMKKELGSDLDFTVVINQITDIFYKKFKQLLN